MALQQQLTQPSQLVGQLGQDYATQLTGLTSVPLDTSQFAPTVAGQDPLQTQAATLAGQGVGSYAPYLSQAATAAHYAKYPGAKELYAKQKFSRQFRKAGKN